MTGLRLSWVIVFVVAVIAVSVRPLRQQLQIAARLPTIPRPAAQEEEGFAMPWSENRFSKFMESYTKRAPDFVRKHYSANPEMLMAAASVSDNRELAREALEKGPTPVTWGAYVDSFLAGKSPGYERLGTSGIDPSDPAAVAENQQSIAESKSQTRLSPKDVAPILSALTTWENGDSENALPVALEAYYLYGLHRDVEARERLIRAGQLPEVTSYTAQRSAAARLLFERMGMPAAEAAFAADYSILLPSYARLRSVARIGVYEGHLARMHNRPQEAVRLWQAVQDLGSHLETSSTIMIGYLVGVAIEGIGAAPAWKWYADGTVGLSGGPLLRGRIFYGKYHDLYVRYAGYAADAQLRDHLVLGKLRTQLFRSGNYWDEPMTGYVRGAELMGLALVVAGLAAVLLWVFLLFGTWRRGEADAAATFGPVAGFVVALLMLALPALGGWFLAARTSDEHSQSWAIVAGRLMAGLLFALVLALLISLAASDIGRKPGVRLLAAWRGNLRRLIPLALAIAALLYLGLGVAAAAERAAWLRTRQGPEGNEMARVIRKLGPSWDHPTVPRDSWRAEYPKLPESPPPPGPGRHTGMRGGEGLRGRTGNVMVGPRGAPRANGQRGRRPADRSGRRAGGFR
jgi:hypothetical protein